MSTGGGRVMFLEWVLGASWSVCPGRIRCTKESTERSLCTLFGCTYRRGAGLFVGLALRVVNSQAWWWYCVPSRPHKRTRTHNYPSTLKWSFAEASHQWVRTKRQALVYNHTNFTAPLPFRPHANKPTPQQNIPFCHTIKFLIILGLQLPQFIMLLHLQFAWFVPSHKIDENKLASYLQVWNPKNITCSWPSHGKKDLQARKTTDYWKKYLYNWPNKLQYFL